MLRRVAFAVLLLASASASARAAEPLRFVVRLDQSVADAPTAGRLFVFLSQRGSREPRFGPSWFNPQPFFAADVKGLAPGNARVIDREADGYPVRLADLEPGTYRVQAVLDHDFYSPWPGIGAGNLMSQVRSLQLDPASSGAVELVLEERIEAQPFPQSKWVEEVALRSELLSEFHGREVIERAAVALPASYYEEPERRYPVVYVVSGFGGGLSAMARPYARKPDSPGENETEFLRVLLSGQCKWGHHMYANSATNGPRGDALVHEMIAEIDRRFRTVAAPTARFVTGHSSGGWSSLWLQVSYPDAFGGVWSIAPDPVDFRDFSGVDLYADPPLSLYTDARGELRPIARRGGRVALWMRDFCRLDDVLGRGGQMRSFEAVFSPVGEDGLPRRLWHRRTGRIDPEVARAWRKYDIRLVLKENWPCLEPKLRGKLHVVAAERDTFYLEGAVRLLGGTLKQLGSDAEVEIVPGADHGSVYTPDLARRIRRQMSDVFFRHHGEAGGWKRPPSAARPR